MKNKLFLILLGFTMLYVNRANAQVSLGVDFGVFNVSDISDDKLTGANFQGRYQLSDRLALGLNFGKYSKTYDEDGDEYKISVVPLTGTIEYRFLKSRFSPYVGMDIGSYTVKSELDFGGVGLGISVRGIGVAPLFGLKYAVSEKFSIYTNAKAHALIFVDLEEGLGAVGFNFGFAYALGRDK